jgi:hypothetical protein
MSDGEANPLPLTWAIELVKDSLGFAKAILHVAGEDEDAAEAHIERVADAMADWLRHAIAHGVEFEDFPRETWPMPGAFLGMASAVLAMAADRVDDDDER